MGTDLCNAKILLFYFFCDSFLLFLFYQYYIIEKVISSLLHPLPIKGLMSSFYYNAHAVGTSLATDSVFLHLFLINNRLNKRINK